MIVRELRQATRSRMRVIASAASVQSAATIFADRDVGLLVVRGDDGKLTGVVSKSDLVRHLAAGGAPHASVYPLVSLPVVSCVPEDDLYAIWQMMASRRLQNAPVLGAGDEPVGVLDIRDALAALLNEERYQETLLANYISGIGYQ